jgi:energy-coupling factor transport system permease protein
MLNPAVTWLFALTLAFLSSSSSSAAWLALFCAIPLAAIAWHVRQTGKRFPRLFVVLAAIVILVRVGFRVVFGQSEVSGAGWQLPNIQLSIGALGELHLLGFVSLNSILAGVTDGLRLASIILAIGMASTLVSARTLLRFTPAALYELSTAISISVNLAPQLIKSLARVQRSRLVRGRSRKISLLTSVVIPVLEDTIDQSLSLAASMDSRGFGYLRPRSRGTLRTLLAISFVFVAIGIYLLLTGVSSLAFIAIALALAATAFSIRTASKNSLRTNAHALAW